MSIDLNILFQLPTVIKVGVIVLVFLYVLFALILIRQITLMVKVVEVPIASLLKVVVFVHFFLSLLLLALTFIIL